MDNYFSLNNRRYLGAKTKLLQFIKEVMEREFKYEKNTFLDLFAGTGVVGYEFSNIYKNIYTNDLLLQNYVALNAFFSYEKIDLDLLKSEINTCNKLNGTVNYYSENFGDKFFSLKNAKKIGSIRAYIDTLEASTRMRHALLTSLFAIEKWVLSKIYLRPDCSIEKLIGLFSANNFNSLSTSFSNKGK